MTIFIETEDDNRQRAGASFIKGWQTGAYQGESLSFPDLTRMLTILTPNRLALVDKLQAIGPSSLRGLARAVGRDVKRVHEDIKVLLEWWLVERTEDRKLIVPYDTIQIRAEIRAPAAA